MKKMMMEDPIIISSLFSSFKFGWNSLIKSIQYLKMIFISLNLQFILKQMKMELIFIQKAKTHVYYMIGNAKLGITTIKNPAYKIGSRHVYDKTTTEIEDKEYEFETISLRGRIEYINPKNTYRIAWFDYVTDEEKINKLTAIYNEAKRLESEKASITAYHNITIEKGDHIGVVKLKEGIYEISMVDMNKPKITRKKYGD
ncbi:hypothetical protein DF185_07870 [Marinifilum breve]|uniref:Uncharacterized protein n=1 Tax=Marinifilum breve TaxID=2184082 RepID=A0A2V3ZY46_9BACT|nr:hypothetical protein [Marinifilum breve]PXY01392.1 hypothetical protein DF185_07870 [Marinifilum breve]